MNIVEDPRITDRACRVTTMVGGIEFICIANVHDDGKKADLWERQYPARWRRHYMVRRYPYRHMGATT